MTGKRWSSGNARPGSRPGAQSPAPGKGRRAARSAGTPGASCWGGKEDVVPRPGAWAGGGPSVPPALSSASGSPSLRGAGDGGASPAGRCWPRRSSGTRSVRVDSVGLSLACCRFAFFFFLLLLCFRFFYVLFFCVCGFFCPSWSQKETVAVSLQQKQRGGCFAGAAEGQPGRAAGWEGRGHQPCPLSPTPRPPPALPAPRSTQQPPPAPVSAMGGQSCCSRGARGQSSPSCLTGDEPSDPQPGQRPLGLGPGEAAWDPGSGSGRCWGRGSALRPAALGSTEAQGHAGQADGAGDVGGGTERLEETLRAGAVGLCGAQPSSARPSSAQPSPGSARGSCRARPRLWLPGWVWCYWAASVSGGRGWVCLASRE